MNFDDSLRLVLLVAGLLPLLLFIADYGWHLRWWETAYGKHLMAFSSVAALFYINSLLRRGFDGWPSWVGLVLLVPAAVVTWQRYIVYRMARRKARKDPDATPKRRATDL